MRDNLEYEAARYDPEPGTRLLTSCLGLGLIVLLATCVLVGIYLQAVKVRSQQQVELAR